MTAHALGMCISKIIFPESCQHSIDLLAGQSVDLTNVVEAIFMYVR